MPTSRLTLNGDIGGISVNSTLTRTADGQIGHDVTLNPAKTGTLSARTSDTEGTLTLESAHGLVDGDIIDVYWGGGRRYDVVVGTVAGDDVPISGGSGDALPAQGTAVTANKQQVIDTDFDGDLLEAIGALCTARAHLGFYDTGALLALSLDLGASELWHWLNGGTAANPLAGKSIDYVVATQAESTAEANLKLGILYDSTV